MGPSRRRLAAAVLAALVHLAVSPALVTALPAAAAVPAGVDDFAFDSFEADYYLDRDGEGRSTLRTVEKLVAQFPDADQNRGIRRALVEEYEGEPTGIELVLVTDENGAPRDYETESEDGFLLVTIAGDEYVHGAQTYVLTYEQRNVTRAREDGGEDGSTPVDEFNWDTNGTGWSQPFGRVAARIHLSPELADRLTGAAACYFGPQGSRERCDLTVSAGSGDNHDEGADAGGSDVLFSASATDLGPGENVTVAIAFAAATFLPRDTSLLGGLLGWFFVAAVALFAVLVFAAIRYRVRVLADGPGRPVIVPEFRAPATPGVPVLGVLIGKTNRVIAATIVSFAVRGILRIVEHPAKGRAKPSYALQLISRDGRPRLGSGPKRLVHADEVAVAAALFGEGLTPGKLRELGPKQNSKLGKALYDAVQAAKRAATAEGYRDRPARPRTVGLVVLLSIAALSVFVLGVILAASAIGGAMPVVILIAVLPVAAIAIVLIARTPLTAKGAEARDYLRGLESYITLAEEQRFRLLQSPDGAAKAPLDPNDNGSVVRLYEQLLPYAVLTGREKQWARELGDRFELAGEQPDWYVGSSAFTPALFSSSIGGLASFASTSYSGSSSSSSSSGSSGGGSSGGGGGGGGGGGV